MAGKVIELINKLIAERSKGNPTVASTTKTKLLLKGIKVENWTASSPDDPLIITKLRDISKEMGILL